MGIDWYPFQLKNEVSKIDFERMIVAQRRFFLEWYYDGSDNSYPPIDEMVNFGYADEMTEYIDAIRVTPIANNPVFPYSWKNDLFTTCFQEEAKQLVQKRRLLIELLRKGRLLNYLKLRYIEHTDVVLEMTWTDLCDCARQVRNRTNNWAQKESVIFACQRIESLSSPQILQESFFEPYWNTLEQPPQFTDPDCPENLDDLLFRIEETVRNFVQICHDWNRAVKAEKCHCFAESFDSFQNKINDPFLDELFEWTQKWIDRGYGMFLSF